MILKQDILFRKIFNSSAFRRLAYKTQVATSPKDTYIRTRASHSGEVAANAITLASNLGLNVELSMAIAFGHDIGHPPFGHCGEAVLSEVLGKPFKHYVAGVVLAQYVENKGKGLNLSYEVLEGILHHSRTRKPLDPTEEVPDEENVVMFSDKVAYTISDVNDAIRYGYLDLVKLPDFVYRLGNNQDERTYKVLEAIIEESERKDKVSFSEGEVFEDFTKLRQFMHQEFYDKMDYTLRKEILRKAYQFFADEPMFEGVDPALALLLLTDKEANDMGQMIVESGRCRYEDLQGLSIFQYLPTFRGMEIDLTDPDLDWGKERERRLIT